MMARMASLVQDVWMGWTPRLRGRRLAPWEAPEVRLLFHLDVGALLDDPAVASLLESLADRLEVIAWEPRGEGGSAGHLGPELLEDARRFARDAARQWGSLPLVLGGFGLGGWLSLASADTPGVSGAFGLAPTLGASESASTPFRSSLVAALERTPAGVPLLLLEGRDRSEGESAATAEWLARQRTAARVVAPGGDEAVLAPPWPSVVATWALEVGRAARR